jgi:hypothetical protein
VVRNLYAYQLDPEQIERLIRRLPKTFEAVSGELLLFADVIELAGSEG